MVLDGVVNNSYLRVFCLSMKSVAKVLFKGLIEVAVYYLVFEEHLIAQKIDI